MSMSMNGNMENMEMMMGHQAAVGVQFAAHIVAEHSITLQTLAGLMGIPLSPADIEELKRYQLQFEQLEHEAAMMVDTMHGHQMMRQMTDHEMMEHAMELVRRFIALNQAWTAYIETLRRYAPTNATWQMEISHMQREQHHMEHNLRHHLEMGGQMAGGAQKGR
ncbi:MAG: hypothetical protein ACM3ZQ_09610 [Bacillota bacterium]